MKLDVSIHGLPPRKDGANSMWRKGTELSRLKALRSAVSRALPSPLPTAASVRLCLRVCASATAGDLDNFIGGICDGLMAAHPNVLPRIDPAVWFHVPPAAHPQRRQTHAYAGEHYRL